MNTNLLGFVLPQLQARRKSLRDVARDSGVPYDTLKKIALGYTQNPGVLHVQRLAGSSPSRTMATHTTS